jgi:hypothetical protein
MLKLWVSFGFRGSPVFIFAIGSRVFIREGAYGMTQVILGENENIESALRSI